MPTGRARRRRADAAGSIVEMPTAAWKPASACTTSEGRVAGRRRLRHQRYADAAHRRAPHRRFHLRKTDRRGRFLDAHRLRGQVGGQFRLQIADADGQNAATRADLARADHFPGVVAGWRFAPGLCLLREQRSRSSSCIPGFRPAPYHRQFPRVPTRRRPGRRTAANWPSCCPRTAARRFFGQRRRQRRAAPDHSLPASTPSRVFSPTARRSFHLRPRRQPADL